jgi:hypothetical protein
MPPENIHGQHTGEGFSNPDQLHVHTSILSFNSISKLQQPSFYPPSSGWINYNSKHSKATSAKSANERTSLPEVQGTFCGRKATFLIDSGASNNFVNLEFVRRGHIPVTSTLSKQTIRLADGSERSSSLTVIGAKLQLGEHHEYGNFTAMPIVFKAIKSKSH